MIDTMSDYTLLLPVLAMVLLTAIVARLMYAHRVAEMKTRRISPQSLASARDIAGKLDDTRAADNYRNLFEAPVLFYVAMLTGVVIHGATPWLTALAWVYVALRYAHSIVHCTYNRVMHRFAAFGSSMLVLMVIWGTLAWQIAQLARH
jgi:hypothetical protein